MKKHGNDAIISPELKGFVDFPLLGAGATSAKTDARLLFFEPDRDGFDVVIGNPPYERLSKSIDAKRKARLIQDKGYKTTNANDLYSLFCEVGLSLAKQEGGVVTMIVPLSIAFGQQQRTIRRLFSKACNNVNTRYYDNIPDTIFNGTPLLKSWKNRQRTAIFTAKLGDSPGLIFQTTGLQGWRAEERKLLLTHRATNVIQSPMLRGDARVADQWPRIPTPHATELVNALQAQKQTIGDLKTDVGRNLAFPKTAYQFIGTLPEGLVHPRNESYLTVGDDDALRLVMAALNGHVGYAWWWIFGDAFHVKPFEIMNLSIPDVWVSDPAPAIELGQKLIDAAPECVTRKLNSGRVWENVNFHLKPDLIEKLDRLHIESLGLDVEPLLTHLKIMRSSSSWDFFGAT